jgi:Putative prokaryotic signal transducing protein
VFCPNCRAEYRPGYTHCSDCGLELVEELPADDSDDFLGEHRLSDLVEVYRAWGRPRGEMIRSLLEGNGIPCALTGGISVYNLTIGDIAEVRVMVRAVDFDAARAVLDAADRGELKLEE